MKGSDKGKPMVAAPGELYSTAQGAPVASAEQIYDYLKEKSQETINTEVQQKLNELEANQGGNDGLNEQQVQNKIDTSLQNLNTENSGTLGSAVAALASAVGNNTSGKSHETRITALENTSPTDYSERLNTIEGNISDLGTGLSNVNTSIQSEETRAKGEESRIEGLISDLQDYVDEQNNIQNELLHVLKQSAIAEFDGIVDTATIRNVSTTEPVTKVIYVTSSKIFAASTQTTVFQTPVLYNNWPNRDLYMNDQLIPYTNKIYVYNGVSYIWDGDSLNPVGGEIIPETPAISTENQVPLDNLDSVRDISKGTKYNVIL